MHFTLSVLLACVLATRQHTCSTGVRQKMSLHWNFGLFLTLTRVVQVELHCCVTCFPHSVRHSCVYETVGQVFCIPSSKKPLYYYLVLLTIVSQLFLPRDCPCAYSFKMLLQRWKQVTIDRRRIPRRNHIHCRIFCREMSCYFVTDLRISQTQIQFFFFAHQTAERTYEMGKKLSLVSWYV